MQEHILGSHSKTVTQNISNIGKSIITYIYNIINMYIDVLKSAYCQIIYPVLIIYLYKEAKLAANRRNLFLNQHHGAVGGVAASELQGPQ